MTSKPATATPPPDRPALDRPPPAAGPHSPPTLPQLAKRSLELDSLRQFLRGESDRFLLEVESARAADCTGDLAQQNFLLNDLILLEEFYAKDPQRNRLIRTDGRLVTPEELADWLAARSA